jgi:exosortase E/protease (VPEID-CTERM system)
VTFPGYGALHRHKVLVLAALLLFELEYLLVTHYEIRTAVRALVRIPLYHALLIFVSMCGLVWWLQPGRFRVRAQFSVPALLVHWVVYGALAASLNPLWAFSSTLPALVAAALWLCLSVALLLPWLCAWLPPGEWKATAREHCDWLAPALGISVLGPYLAEFTSSWWYAFARVTFSVTDALLLLLFDDSIVKPESFLLGTSRFIVMVEPGCSGYEGIGLIALLLSAYLWLKRSEVVFPAALALLPLGMAVIWCANILRLILLVVIGSKISQGVAMRGFHSQAGWISFTLVGLGLMWLAETRQWFRAKPQEGAAETWAYPALPFLLPFMALLFSTMLTQALTDDFNYAYGVKFVIAGAALLYFFPAYRQLFGAPTPVALGGGLFVYAFWTVMIPHAQAASPFERLPASLACLWIGVRIVGGVVVVPLVEELAFRGYLLRRLQSANFEALSTRSWSWPALMVSSLAFGLVHNEWFAGSLAGAVYAWLSTRRGGLSNAVAAHALTNLCIALEVTAWGHWWLWN